MPWPFFTFVFERRPDWPFGGPIGACLRSKRSLKATEGLICIFCFKKVLKLFCLKKFCKFNVQKNSMLEKLFEINSE